MRMKIFLDDIEVYNQELPTWNDVEYKRDLVSCYQLHRGTKEYEGIVADIQNWYYGKLSKTSWCATSISYFCNKLGILDKIGGKAENVNVMRDNCKKAAEKGYGEYFEGNNIPKQLKRGDLLFWLWKGDVMTNTSSKHVGIAEYDTVDKIVYCIGGNQKDKICTLGYDKQCLYAVYRIK